ncbi:MULTISPECIES: PAS domain-containing hybrid sensor histidine kinase/response regulator [unclassified Aureimonas]|uniref:hybrid sensor histidine kinase/response regulator n=1 Tax=unclassified Aureimonas TaxID=2615206 RepID=UPI0006FC8379|nr:MULTISPECIES: PAS domain-containing hybrid sensor histidine kinase/response regulator [unclassified Aureimonas]KQT60662.1 histidine kinase [Aureimonas sp. Leaf460]KQT68791.1 histidine kinase [Aureimonas sp. Leaf427]
MQSWIIAVVAIAYLLFLFVVAHFGDRRSRARSAGGRPGVYALSLAVYCTSWTFFGSVGVAARDGLAFFAIYCGPILVFVFATPVLDRIITLAKAEKITTIADFIGSRYGKSTSVAAIAALIALIGAVPYIALQLKAISIGVATVVEHYGPGAPSDPPVFGDAAFYIALALGIFAILFGTRHADATEHQDGLVLAVALESIVKLAAFLAVGLWVTFGLFEPDDLLREALASPRIAEAFAGGLDGRFVASMILSACAIVFLPRQFHMTVVENRTREELRRARWLFPLYLVAINIFVLPVAAAGLLRLGDTAEADFYVLALPLAEGHDVLSLVAFIGGLSAATAMVIVACVALSIMVSNDLVLPLILKRDAPASDADATRLILKIRRSAILAIVLLGYLYYRVAGGSSALAAIGLLSFAAIAQFAPAVFLGLLWKRANARGAKAGLLIGIAAWAYTLLLPAVSPEAAIVGSGLFGLSWLRPEAMFGLDLDQLMHGVFVSLSANSAALVIGSLTRRATPRERIQASIFVRPDGAGAAFRRPRAEVTVGELKSTIARYLGPERTERSFRTLETEDRRALPDTLEADGRVIGFSEQLLGSAIGSASSRLVLSLLLQRHKGSTRSAIRLLDDASEALQYNRDILRIALDQVDQGLAVFDGDFRLTVWNRQLRELLDLPQQFGQVGTPLTAILDELRAQDEIDAAELQRSFEFLTESPARHQMSLKRSNRVIEIRTNPMPGGGLVATVSDMTERVRRAAALRDMNESLEERVRQRTAELVEANEALGEARRIADAANLGKTRFLAAAGHDILQPLNAARLYAAALQEKHATLPGTSLAANINSSIESVEAILGAILDISRLDAGAMPSRLEDVELQPLLAMIQTDLAPLAAEKGVRLTFVPTTVTVHSDRNLLRRLVQNLVSNAVKYTREGKVVVGIRHCRMAKTVDISVVDSGIGIPGDQLERIFQEFIRLDEGTRTAEGLGLGLSIVDRIARVLDHPVSVTSEHGRGTRFRVTLPKVGSKLLAPPRPLAARVHRALKLDGMRVLVVDNEATIRSGMEVLLTGWNCRVALAATPAEALERASSTSLDIVLVDYHLGEANGLDVVAELRRAIDPALPAILITADRSASLRETAAQAGIDLLTKPVKPASLRAAMAQGRGRRVAAE